MSHCNRDYDASIDDNICARKQHSAPLKSSAPPLNVITGGAIIFIVIIIIICGVFIQYKNNHSKVKRSRTYTESSTDSMFTDSFTSDSFSNRDDDTVEYQNNPTTQAYVSKSMVMLRQLHRSRHVTPSTQSTTLTECHLVINPQVTCLPACPVTFPLTRQMP